MTLFVSSVEQLPCPPGDEAAEPVGRHIHGISGSTFPDSGGKEFESERPHYKAGQDLNDMWRTFFASVADSRNSEEERRQKTGNEEQVVQMAAEERGIKAKIPGGEEVEDVYHPSGDEDPVLE